MKNIKKRGWFAVLFMKKIGAGHVKTAYSDDLSNYLLMNAKNRKAVRYLGTAEANRLIANAPQPNMKLLTIPIPAVLKPQYKKINKNAHFRRQELIWNENGIYIISKGPFHGVFLK
ncbi:MAG: hypothetical protein JWQ10_3624 [Herbaspirillum sp.]|jgi:hypothetical protein|nr:hypothetical protein [Herbaspirillum sp.]